jgi:hypothetical protein
LLIALLLLVAALGIRSLHQIQSLAETRLRDDSIPGINNIADIGTYTLRVQIRTLMVCVKTDPAARE